MRMPARQTPAIENRCGFTLYSYRCRKGFTLVEIIAVLLILGILAAIALPKYLDMSQQAQKAAFKDALAQGYSTASLQYARLIMSNSTVPTTAEIASACSANPPGSEEFTYSFSPLGAEVSVTVFKGSVSESGTWKIP